ncbi:hydantoinase/oxoprolinase family protein [Streptosporangium pseudovulgare]|uniref:Methylhydantoinase n=1 Tax=Streptosporangium pseudovulgare TaxID=35765 RepID=A0ABQ2RAU5_9ACTN|nr:hydantoinase/oxoprolinase family protein [Streptosporangium pseudovulgare]GGQ22599.1 methylhydantoinase [Streptosporangium pseudovulgare]
MTLRIGVDTGGTFTDIVVYDEATGAVHVRKVSSTPADPGLAIVEGVESALEQIGGRGMGEVSYFAHGTTVGTNALLTHRGARTGVITTRGFRDLLELGRGRRPDLYDLQADKAVPFAARDLRLEVTERVRHDGRVEIALDEQEVRAAAKTLREHEVEAVAVCFLYSFLRPEHEQRAGEILAEELPGAHISLSSRVLPEFREFERLSTVVTNAYVGPVVARYLERLRGRLAERGLTAVPHVTQSNGGILPFQAAEAMPVRVVLSGPSTGVVGAAGICAGAGHPDIITFDMGGTSSDISLVQNGVPKVTTGMELDGRPIRTPMLDIHTVGAGGGSLAHVDAGGHLKVGPASAGADPGPACYGKGSEATVTDANVVLHTLNPAHLLDGRMAIDEQAARAAVGRVAERVGLGVEEAAEGILRVVTANMARAIRVISVQRGYDPRDYTLVPFGGAGPLHASRLARELGMRTVLVPPTPGAQSALGLLMTDVRADFSRTRIQPFREDSARRLGALYEELDGEARDWFEQEGVEAAERSVLRTAELRYAGQNYEIPVPVPDGPITEETVLAVLTAFAAEHRRLYGYDAPGDPVEAVTLRLQATGSVPRAELPREEAAGPDAAASLIGTRAMHVPELGGYVEVPVHRREAMRPGNRLEGPAVIEQMDTTTVLLPGDRLTVDAHSNLVIAIGGAQ